MTLATAAIDYAESHHASVFPLIPGTKQPNGRLAPNGYKDATHDIVRVSAFWEKEPDSGIGLACAPSGLVVLDIDPRNGGQQTFDALAKELGPLPQTWTCLTPGGGWHLYFLDDEGDYRGSLGDGVDVKFNGYVVAPPSLHPDGGAYQWTPSCSPGTRPTAHLPDAWRERMKRRPPPIPVSRPLAPGDTQKKLYKRARADVAAHEPAIAGAGGHNQTFATARRLMGYVLKGLREHVGWNLLVEYNTRCQPPWRERDLEHKWIDAHKAESIPEIADRPAPPRLRVVSSASAIATAASPTADDPPARPRIEAGLDVHRVLDELDAALAMTEPRIYQRCNELVVVCGAEDADVEKARFGLAPGTPILRALTSHTLLPCITEHIDYVRWHQPKPTKKDPDPEGEWQAAWPAPQVQMGFLSRPHWTHIRPIRGITETPIIHLDGRITSAYGYDAATGYLVTPNVQLPPIPESPTQGDSARALAALLEPFAEFPYEEEIDRYAPVALILTMLLRPVLTGNVPGFVQVAPQKNCGKSLISKAACLVVDGRTPGACTWPKENEEQEKIIGSAAIAGARVLFFDNAAQGAVIGGAPLDKLLTCDGQDSFRVLGQSTLKTLPWGGVVVFSGNRARIGGDADRRMAICRLIRPDAPVESHTHPDLLSYVLENRARLLGAAFTLIRGWIAAGRPRAGANRLDSFEQWSWTVPPMIAWAGGQDMRGCVRDGEDENEDDISSHELVFLEELDRFLLACEKTDTTTADLLSALYPSDNSWKTSHDDWVALRDSISGMTARKDKDNRPDGHSFGQAVKLMKGTRRGDLRLVTTGKTDKRQRWKTVRRKR